MLHLNRSELNVRRAYEVGTGALKLDAISALLVVEARLNGTRRVFIYNELTDLKVALNCCKFPVSWVKRSDLLALAELRELQPIAHVHLACR